MKSIIYLTLAALLICPAMVYSQTKVVSGTVSTFKEIPLVNVSILVKSSGIKYYSDSLGLFSVNCSVTDELVLDAEGFRTRKVKVKKETMHADINLILLPKEEAKELAIGYGHVKDKNKLYAMSGDDGSGINYSRYKSIYEILEVSFAGVQVIGGEVIIRNTSSFEGSNPALLIVDGREVSAAAFGSISTSDIAQINILKDSSAAIYGVQGANGVVVVETKRGGKF